VRNIKLKKKNIHLIDMQNNYDIVLKKIQTGLNEKGLNEKFEGIVTQEQIKELSKKIGRHLIRFQDKAAIEYFLKEILQYITIEHVTKNKYVKKALSQIKRKKQLNLLKQIENNTKSSSSSSKKEFEFTEIDYVKLREPNHIYVNQLKDPKHVLGVEKKAPPCDKCKSTTTKYYHEQTRSSDEPTSFFIVCNENDNIAGS
jgi:DNA-directed RNA polymerase subunit M/transcription elongation factor TFIIS